MLFYTRWSHFPSERGIEKMQVKIELILNYLHLGFDALSDWLKISFYHIKNGAYVIIRLTLKSYQSAWGYDWIMYNLMSFLKVK